MLELCVTRSVWGVRLIAINNVATKPLGLTFAIASYWCKTAAKIQHPSPIIELLPKPGLRRGEPAQPLASNKSQQPLPCSFWTFEVSWPWGSKTETKGRGEGRGAGLSLLGGSFGPEGTWALLQHIPTHCCSQSWRFSQENLDFTLLLWCYSKRGLWWINPLAANKVSIRKISGKINICLVAMQLFSVANPNKFLFEGVHFHTVNQQTKAFGCEADGWVLRMVHACPGCCVECWNCFGNEQSHDLSFLDVSLASLISASWKEWVPVHRSFLKCTGGSLGSDFLALKEVHIQAKQTNRRNYGWGTWSYQENCHKINTGEGTVIFLVGRKGQCFLSHQLLASSSLFGFQAPEHFQPHSPEHTQLHLCPAVSPVSHICWQKELFCLCSCRFPAHNPTWAAREVQADSWM